MGRMLLPAGRGGGKFENWKIERLGHRKNWLRAGAVRREVGGDWPRKITKSTKTWGEKAEILKAEI